MRQVAYLFALLFFLVFIPVIASSQTIDRESLNLNGANIHNLDVSDDGSFIIAAAQGPFGLFYSTDFGDTWNDARDETYTAGEGKSALILDDKIYAAAGDNVYVSDLVAPPVWSILTLEGGFNAYTLGKAGNFLILGSQNGTIAVYDTDAETFVETSTLPDAETVESISVDTTNSFIFAVVGTWLNGNAAVYRATFNTTTGEIGSWVTAEPATSSTYATGVFVAPNGHVYVPTSNAPSNNGIYKSTDNGSTYARISDGDGIITFNASFAFFQGTTFLVGNYISTDSGATWEGAQQTEQGTHLNPNAGVINPSDPTMALMSSDVGIAKSENIDEGTESTWNESNQGLSGLIVNGFAQLPDNKDRVVLATKSGVAFTDNFTDGGSAIDWEFPIVPLGNGSPARAAVFDPTDNNRVFLGYNEIYEGTIDTSSSPSLSWTNVYNADNMYQFMNVTQLATVGDDILVATFASSEQTLYGKLVVADISGGGFTVTETALTGKPVKSFVAVNSSIMFAGLGVIGNVAGATNSTNRGIWLSEDGGTTWTQLTDGTIPEIETSIASQLAYDATNDILYVAASDLDADGGDDDGTIFILRNAASSERSWSAASEEEVETNGGFTAVAVDAATGDAYASSGPRIYRSTDQGVSWDLYYTGVQSESTTLLFFDDLVQGSNTGFWALGEQNSSSLTSPIYAGWNGHLRQVNVAELLNVGESSFNVTITMYNAAGVEQSSTTVAVSAKSQLDVVLNNLTGFATDSYGIVKLTWEGNDLRGRMQYYSLPEDDENVLFAYALPFNSGVTGTTYVPFNTYNPSTDPSETGTVKNWITIINQEAEAKIFTVKRYDEAGELNSAVSVSVPAFSRLDVDGGHDAVGPHHVGLDVIEPADSSAEYFAYMIRYGERKGSFSFALPSIARTGTTEDEQVPVSGGGSAANWVAIINASAESVIVRVELYDSTGDDMLVTNIPLPGYGQWHINSNEFVGVGSGFMDVEVISGDGAIFTESSFYHRDNSGDVDAAYLSPSRLESSGPLWGTWNTFLGMDNWLRLANPSDESADVTVTLYNNGTPTVRNVTLNQNTSLDLGLHESVYGSSASRYGVVSVETTQPIIADILRYRLSPNDSRVVDFGSISAAVQ